MKIHVIVVIVAVVLFYYFVLQHQEEEGIDNTPPQTMFTVGNAFTGLTCYNENHPIVSQDGSTFTCISKDGTNCLYKQNLNIPNNVSCKNINTYLSKDGVRQLPSSVTGGQPNSRDIFDDLSKNGYYTLQCNYKALNDPNHWCGKISASYKEWCGTLDRFAKASNPGCDSIPLYAEKVTDSTITKTLFKNLSDSEKAANSKMGIIDMATVVSCQNKDCVRNKPSNITASECKANCSKCGKTKC